VTLCGMVGLAVAASALGQTAEFHEQVTAERVVVDVRVIDNVGNPIRDLGPDDFRVWVDGTAVALESVDWISQDTAARAPVAALPDEPPEATRFGPAPGRLIVLFFQADFEWSRITGLLRMLRQARRFVDTCGPDDRVAVLSFDSRLKLRQDFTRNRARIKHAIERAIYSDSPPRPKPGPAPSLARYLDFDAAGRATLPEQALRITGDALGRIPGAKSMIFFGWGLGNYDPGFGLILDHNYEPARRALVEARTTVFSLDVTSADSHSMQGGLAAISADTGGFYVKTHVFPAFAMEKVERAMSGYYVLTFARPPLARGHHRMRIRGADPHWWVLARNGYDD
jgi:VWFA-related protein